MKSIIVIGNFGKKNKADGQVMRTNTIYNSLKKEYSTQYNIEMLDTSRKNIFFLFSAIRKILISYRIVILPASGALKPLLFLINILGASRKTVHIPIGGWLDESLNKRIWIKIESKFKVILVQVQTLKKSLEKLGLKNVVYFPNYREDTKEKISVEVKTKPYKNFVFFARIIPEKGVLEAIDAINMLNEEGGRLFFKRVWTYTKRF